MTRDREIQAGRRAPLDFTQRAGQPCAQSALVVLGLALFAVTGCGRPPGPPAIDPSAECVACGMNASSARFACEAELAGHWRVYDSIECLVHDAGSASPRATWLPDYDSGQLHRADSVWVVQGHLATPMGGGLVAFMDRAAADDVARSSQGRVARFGELAAMAGTKP